MKKQHHILRVRIILLSICGGGARREDEAIKPDPLLEKQLGQLRRRCFRCFFWCSFGRTWPVWFVWFGLVGLVGGYIVGRSSTLADLVGLKAWTFGWPRTLPTSSWKAF